MTKDEAITIATKILLDAMNRTDDTQMKIELLNTKYEAMVGNKESVMILYHCLTDYEKLISEVKQALKEE